LVWGNLKRNSEKSKKKPEPATETEERKKKYDDFFGQGIRAQYAANVRNKIRNVLMKNIHTSNTIEKVGTVPDQNSKKSRKSLLAAKKKKKIQWLKKRRKKKT